MEDPAFWHRLQFGFTVVFHYLFPQITMGVAPLLAVWSWRKLRDGEGPHARAVRFWARIFGITFGIGVVTGIPMEFQFGTNWAGFSKFAGGVIGQTLAMEGMFAFFLESAMIGALVWGERVLGPRSHFLAALGVFVGSWLSGYFILTTNAFMQHPVGHSMASDGTLQIADLGAYLLNPWAIVEFAHTMTAAVVTGSFVVAAVGAFYALRGVHREQSGLYLKWGCAAGLLASLLVAFPTGDQQAKMVARHQEVALAAMEGRFQSGSDAPLTLIGEPDIPAQRLENPIRLPGMLSFLAYGTFHSDVRGLDAFPQQEWPPQLVLIYYSFHVMSGLGTLFILLMTLCVLALLRGRLHRTRGLLWALMLAAPFPFIANTAGWMTAELGRQPWLVYGLFGTREGMSRQVSTGQTIFTLIGFAGIYFVLGLLYLALVGRDVLHGPEEPVAEPTAEQPPALGAAHG